MRQVLGIVLLIIAASCSELTKSLIEEELNDNSFIWTISQKDTTITMNVHFFNDSIYVLEFEEDSNKFANIGFWRVIDDSVSKSLYLNMNDINKEFSPKIESWRNNTLKLSYGDKSYEALRKIPIEVINKNSLIGSWIANRDSIPTFFAEYNRTGKLLTNPTFRFDQDTFKIKTDGFFTKGKYQVINNSNYVILETNHIYWRNFVLIIESADTSQLKLRFQQGETGKWKSYELERNSLL